MSFFFSTPLLPSVTQRLPPLQHFPLTSWECDTMRKLLIWEELLGSFSSLFCSGHSITLVLFRTLDDYSNSVKLHKLPVWFTEHMCVCVCIFKCLLQWSWHQCCALKAENNYMMLHHIIHSSPNVLHYQQNWGFITFLSFLNMFLLSLNTELHILDSLNLLGALA